MPCMQNSPFQADKRLVLAASDVSSRYSRRGRTQYERIADYIEGVIGGKTGNLHDLFSHLISSCFRYRRFLRNGRTGKLKFDGKPSHRICQKKKGKNFF